MNTWKYFSLESDPLIAGLEPELVSMLDFARDKAGVPFIITSGKRTPEQNASLVGAVPDSAHLKGLAVDLACGDSHELWCMVFGLMAAGFRRIIVYTAECSDSSFLPKHIHVDIDTTKPTEIMPIYKEQN